MPFSDHRPKDIETFSIKSVFPKEGAPLSIKPPQDFRGRVEESVGRVLFPTMPMPAFPLQRPITTAQIFGKGFPAVGLASGAKNLLVSAALKEPFLTKENLLGTRSIREIPQVGPTFDRIAKSVLSANPLTGPIVKAIPEASGAIGEGLLDIISIGGMQKAINEVLSRVTSKGMLFRTVERLDDLLKTQNPKYMSFLENNARDMGLTPGQVHENFRRSLAMNWSKGGYRAKMALSEPFGSRRGTARFAKHRPKTDIVTSQPTAKGGEIEDYLYRYHPKGDLDNVIRRGLEPYTQEQMIERAVRSGDADKWGWDEESRTFQEDPDRPDLPRIFFTPDATWKVAKDRVQIRIKKSAIKHDLILDEYLPPDVYMEGEDVGVPPEDIEIKVKDKWIPLNQYKSKLSPKEGTAKGGEMGGKINWNKEDTGFITYNNLLDDKTMIRKNMTRKQYFEQEKGMRGEIVYMSPDQYIEESMRGQWNNAPESMKKGFDGYEDFKSKQLRIRSGDAESNASIKEGIANKSPMKIPVIEYEQNGDFRNQEGYHRVLIAKEIGEQSIPVLYVNKPKLSPKEGTAKGGEIDLYAEARKYKTAEDFIHAHRQSHLMDLSNPEKHWVGRAIPMYEDEPFTDIVQIIKNKDRAGSYLSTMKYSNPTEYKAITSPDDMITIYRAVPSDISDSIRVGDYVALDKRYAQMHLDSVLEGQQGVRGKIISKTVPKKDVVWGETDFTEWAYSPKELRDKYKSLKSIWEKASKLSPTAKGGEITRDFGLGSRSGQMLIPGGKDVNALKERIIENVQDYMRRVKKMQDGAVVTEGGDPYLAETLYWGRLSTRLGNAKNTLEAIVNDIAETAKKSSIPFARLNRMVHSYLWATHAPERNVVHGKGAAGITTENAEKMLIALNKHPMISDVKRIAGNILSLNRQVLDLLKNSQVITGETYEILRNKYKNHIPLNRVIDDSDDFNTVLTGKGMDVRSTGIKKAGKSELTVDDILTSVAVNLEHAIMRSEKNLVDLSTYEFMKNNPSSGIREMTEEEFAQNYQRNMNDPRILTMYKDGVKTHLKIDDPDLALALRGKTKEQVDALTKFAGTFSRYISMMATRVNPEFALSNVIRDMQEVVIHLAAQKQIGISGAGRFVTKQAQSVKDVMDSLAGKDTPGAKLYEQMKLDGGTTGGLALSTRKKIELDIENIKKLAESAPRRAVELLFKYLDNFNTVFEDSSRLSVYKTALEKGMTRKQAAFLAKESSINFNRMGRMGPIVNAWWAFSNPSIQGSLKMMRDLKNPNVALAVAAVLGGSVAAVHTFNGNMDKDWKKKVSKWDRMNGLNIVLRSDDRGILYLNIPIGWGIKPIKAMMDMGSDIVSGDGVGLSENVGRVASSIIDSYNPLGGTDLASSLSPTILDPVIDLARGRSWSGSQIKPAKFSKYAPEDVRFFESLYDEQPGRMFIKGTEKLADVGIEISPADVNYVYEQIIGGAGRFTGKVYSTLTTKPSDLPVRKIPFVSRFLRFRDAEQIRADLEKLDEQRERVLVEKERRKKREKLAEYQKLSKDEKRAAMRERIEKARERDRKSLAKEYILRGDLEHAAKLLDKKEYVAAIRSVAKDLSQNGRVSEARSLIENTGKLLQGLPTTRKGFKKFIR